MKHIFLSLVSFVQIRWRLVLFLWWIQFDESVVAAVVATTTTLDYETPEPFAYLHGYCADCNPPVWQSPDPLVSMNWNSHVNTSELQIYRVHGAVGYKISPPEAHVDGVESLVRQASSSSSSSSSSLYNHGDGYQETFATKTHLKVYQNCTIMLDWGVERAAWLELVSTSPNVPNVVRASLSEYNQPHPTKSHKPLTRYGAHTYRLETNDELYEGIRFTFFHFTFSDTTADKTTGTTRTPEAIEIADISLVAKIKPVNYTGSFASSNDMLTTAWYTGAYGVRLNMEANSLNSILMQRGDRVAIQGDGHPAMDAALVAFAPFALIRNVLHKTDSAHKRVVDDAIMAYPLYWCISAMDYFMASGDVAFFQQVLVKDIATILDERIADFLDPDLDMAWFGWDDRLGNGWCHHSRNDTCPREAHLSLAGLILRVCQDYVHVLRVVDYKFEAQKYAQICRQLSRRLRQVPEWPHGFGVHATANAINAGVPSRHEVRLWMNSTLNNPVTICSLSQFNQYWILQAFGNADQMEHALASIKLCWGPMLKNGRGCFWEISSPEWTRFMNPGDQAPDLPSYCHPWASGVTAWLSHVLGGLQPIKPGYREFAALPYVSPTYPTVETSIATATGKIAIHASLLTASDDRDNYSFNAYVNAPHSGVFGLRFNLHGSNDDKTHFLMHSSILVNGAAPTVISPESFVPLLGKNERTRAHVFLRLGTGANHITASYYPNVVRESKSGRRRQLDGPFPEPSYPASICELDRHSQGGGLLSHGRDGFVLLGYNQGKDVLQLPNYIFNVTVRRHDVNGWRSLDREFLGNSGTNQVYLPFGTERALGTVGHDGFGGGNRNCILVDVTISYRQSYSLSIYFVGTSRESRHAVRVMDGDSLNVIAPTVLITEYEHGVWWTVDYDSSVRLRLMDIRGVHLSAIAFTPQQGSQTGLNFLQ